MKGSPRQIYDRQLKRFAACTGGINEGMEVLQRAGKRDLIEFASGTPSGSARLKQLRDLGHPLGRLSATPLKQGFGRQRGSLNPLPMSPISGDLKASAFSSVDNTKLTLGFNSKAGGAIYRVMPGGTSKLVDSGLWGPNEGGELGKRMKARRKAFYETFLAPMRKP